MTNKPDNAEALAIEMTNATLPQRIEIAKQFIQAHTDSILRQILAEATNYPNFATKGSHQAVPISVIQEKLSKEGE